MSKIVLRADQIQPDEDCPGLYLRCDTFMQREAIIGMLSGMSGEEVQAMQEILMRLTGEEAWDDMPLPAREHKPGCAKHNGGYCDCWVEKAWNDGVGPESSLCVDCLQSFPNGQLTMCDGHLVCDACLIEIGEADLINHRPDYLAAARDVS